MKFYRVHVKTETQIASFLAIARNGFDAHAIAVDRFGPCKISVSPA